MAAPKTVYSTQDIKMTSGTTSHRLCRMPKARSVYVNESNTKGWFYLDKIYYTKDKNGVDCFIGCVIEGSGNAAKHAAKRMSHLRVSSGTTNYVVLTDGGMNTLSPISFNNAVLPHYGLPKAATNVVFCDYEYMPAYYLSGTTKLDYWLNGSAQHTLTNIKNYEAQPSTAYIGDSATVSISPSTSSTIYNFRLLNVNSEGGVSGNTLQTYVRGGSKMITVRKVSSISDNYTTGTSYNVLVFEDYYQTLASSTQNSGHYEYPNLKNLFATATSSTLTTNSLMNTGSTAAVTSVTWGNVLPQGMYYGFPTTYNGTDYKIVYINSTGYAYKWATSTYTPVATIVFTWSNSTTAKTRTMTDGFEATITETGIISTKNGSNTSFSFYSNTFPYLEDSDIVVNSAGRSLTIYLPINGTSETKTGKVRLKNADNKYIDLNITQPAAYQPSSQTVEGYIYTMPASIYHIATYIDDTIQQEYSSEDIGGDQGFSADIPSQGGWFAVTCGSYQNIGIVYNQTQGTNMGIQQMNNGGRLEVFPGDYIVIRR